jgi:hypothetical protein
MHLGPAVAEEEPRVARDAEAGGDAGRGDGGARVRVDGEYRVGGDGEDGGVYCCEGDELWGAKSALDVRVGGGGTHQATDIAPLHLQPGEHGLKV